MLEVYGRIEMVYHTDSGTKNNNEVEEKTTIKRKEGSKILTKVTVVEIVFLGNVYNFIRGEVISGTHSNCFRRRTDSNNERKKNKWHLLGVNLNEQHSIVLCAR